MEVISAPSTQLNGRILTFHINININTSRQRNITDRLLISVCVTRTKTIFVRIDTMMIMACILQRCYKLENHSFFKVSGFSEAN